MDGFDAFGLVAALLGIGPLALASSLLCLGAAMVVGALFWSRSRPAVRRDTAKASLEGGRPLPTAGS